MLITIYLMWLHKLTTSIRWEKHSLVNKRFYFYHSWIFFTLSGWQLALLFTQCDWLSDWWQGRAIAAAIKRLSPQTSLCISSFFLFLPLSLAPFRSILPQASPVPSSVDAHFPLSISHASHEYLCVPVKISPWNHGTGRLIHLVTWSQLAPDGFMFRHFSCSGGRDGICYSLS